MAVETIFGKVHSGERLTFDEALELYQKADFYRLGHLAKEVRFRRHPEPVVSYVVDRNINYSNTCICGCRFCAFYRPPGHPEAYILTKEELTKKIEETLSLGGTQILMQGGHHPDLSLAFYEDMLSFIKSRFPIHIHAFSPPEIVHFAQIENTGLSEVISRLSAAGLDSIPGGGAEILVDAVRKRVSPNKCTAAEWLLVMEEAHKQGLRTTATMMFGHEEEPRHRAEHLLALRDLQDRTGGFTAFILWPFQPTNTAIHRSPETSIGYLRLLALSRIVLDNFDNIQASWVTMGPKVAQLALHFGANDFGSTMIEENVVAATGVHFRLSVQEIRCLIEDAGFEPRQRTMAYEWIEPKMNSSMPHAASGRPLKPVAPLVRAKTEQAAVDLPFFHRAEWLVPVAFPPIQDGAVLVRGSQILAAGPYAQVKAASPANTKQVDHGSSAIMPALVNAHTHLELSGLCGHIGLPQESFAQWLKELLSLRPSMTPERLQAGFLTGLSQLTASGCGLYGDITNGACLQTDAKWHARLAPANDEGKQVFLEVLGFDREGLADALGPDLVQALSMAASVKLPLSLAAHASYSTSGAVIHEAKEWCRRRGLRFSIHVAEHLDEIEFLKNGTGFCRELLESLGRWTPYWTPPASTPVRYLEQLQVLDAQTLLVHAVHMTDADWEIVIKNQCPVCFCPRSNRNLNVGQPDLGKALRCGVVTALGTDSLASNTDLDLFAEAAHVLENYSDMPPEAILQMITLGGAKALGQEQQFGTIEPGKRSHLLAVSLPESFPSHQLFETIIQRGNKGARRWAHHPAKGCA